MPETSGRVLVVHADDLGLTASFNRGILEAHQNGFLTSTSLRTDGAAFDEAVAEVLAQCPDLGVGVHLNVVEGRNAGPHVRRNSRICDAEGRYRASFASLMKAYLAKDKATFVEVRDHFRFQIETVLNRGVHLDHLNSHQHSHAVPAVFEVVCHLAAEYGIPFVRLPRERFSLGEHAAFHLGTWFPVNVAKHFALNALSIRDQAIARSHRVRTNDYFIGILYTGHVTRATLKRALRRLSAERTGIAEILLHPSKTIQDQTEEYVAPYLRDYVHDQARVEELATVLDAGVRQFIEDEGWTLTSYGRLVGINISEGDAMAGPAHGS